jgi:hypothetical protein
MRSLLVRQVLPEFGRELKRRLPAFRVGTAPRSTWRLMSAEVAEGFTWHILLVCGDKDHDAFTVLTSWTPDGIAPDGMGLPPWQSAIHPGHTAPPEGMTFIADHSKAEAVSLEPARWLIVPRLAWQWPAIEPGHIPKVYWYWWLAPRLGMN